jgi:hypothetical protein
MSRQEAQKKHTQEEARLFSFMQTIILPCKFQSSESVQFAWTVKKKKRIFHACCHGLFPSQHVAVALRLLCIRSFQKEGSFSQGFQSSLGFSWRHHAMYQT